MPESFFILSREHVELARDEIEAIAKSYDRFAKGESYDNLVIIQSKISWETIAKRATFVKLSGKVLRKLSHLFLDEENYSQILNAKTFACKTINLSSQKIDVYDLEKSLGNMISIYTKGKISLDEPEVTIYFILTDRESFFGIAKSFEKPKRPVKVKKFPHELDWKLSRIMINLAGLKEGDVICDPFCGTGSTLLEAESMGIRSIGIDLDKKMLDISKQNLIANNYSADIINADFSHLSKISEKYDGIVTDLPYGRASKTSQNPNLIMKELIGVIPKKKKFVIMCKKGTEEQIGLKPSKRYDIYRHKSLTRTILVK